MKSWIKELLVLAGLMLLSILSVYLINRPNIEGTDVDYSTVSINIHDTYFVTESKYFAGIVFTILVFLVYLIRTIISRFRDRILNCLCIISTILFIILLTYIINLNSKVNLERDQGLMDGDIIFQESQSAQSQAIQLATGSRYSHCGIIYKKGDDYLVYEAIQPVQTTPLDEWIARGKDGHYVVKRLKKADHVLTPQAIAKMKDFGRRLNGREYDLYFEWGDDRIYCSELVWKIYKEGAGIEVGALQQLKDFDLSSPAVQQKLKERYGSNIPKDEKVISPAAIFDSELLYTVASN